MSLHPTPQVQPVDAYPEDGIVWIGSRRYTFTPSQLHEYVESLVDEIVHGTCIEYVGYPCTMWDGEVDVKDEVVETPLEDYISELSGPQWVAFVEGL